MKEDLLINSTSPLLNSSLTPAFLIEENDFAELENIVGKINFSLMLLGIINNTLCICVFLQKNLIIRKFNWYLFVLAIIELVFCSIVFIDYLFRIVYIKPIFLHDLNIYVNMLIDFAIHTTDSYVVIITLILSIDRLYAIKFPIKIRYFVTNLHSKSLIIVTLVVLIVFKIPGIILCYKNDNQNFNIIFCTFISPLILNVIPTIVILVLNSILVIKIINYNRMKSKENITTTTTAATSTTAESNGSIVTEGSIISRHGTWNSITKFKSSLRNHSEKRQQQQRNYYQTQRLLFTRFSNYRPMTRTQKSHYIVIMILAVWLVFTTIPYYGLNTYGLLFRLNLFQNLMDLETIVKIQIISSVFFNSNHCINFFIYFCFHDAFRSRLIKIFSRLCFKLTSASSNARYSRRDMYKVDL